MSDQFSPRLATGWPGVSPDLCGSWTEGLLATATQPGPKAAVVGDAGVACMWITFMPAPGKLASVRVADDPLGDAGELKQNQCTLGHED
jgi:hypothetical protein